MHLFAQGMLVRQKSGGYAMRVERVLENPSAAGGAIVLCHWTDLSGHLKSGDFPAAQLEPLSGSGVTPSGQANP